MGRGVNRTQIGRSLDYFRMRFREGATIRDFAPKRIKECAQRQPCGLPVGF